MTRTSKTLRPAILFVVVCCLMAFGVTAAQAEPGAEWRVNGAAITTALKVQGRASLVNNHGILLTKIGLSTVEILCTTLEFAHILLEELGSGKGKLAVKGCVTLLNKKVAAACVPHSPGDENGVIITNAGHALLKLHILSSEGKEIGRDDLAVLLPDTGSVFVTLVLGKESGSECAIGNKIDITGSLFLKDSKNEALVDMVEHEIEEGPLSALLFGGNPAKIDGRVRAFLGGPHTGMTVSGIVN